MALRDQFLAPEYWSQLKTIELSQRDRRDIADVATGVHSAEAAAFLLRELKQSEPAHDTLLRYVHHVARYGARNRLGTWWCSPSLRRRSMPERLHILRAIQEGEQERGAALDGGPERGSATGERSF